MWVWYRAAAKLENPGINITEISFGTYSHKTGKSRNQIFFTLSRPGCYRVCFPHSSSTWIEKASTLEFSRRKKKIENFKVLPFSISILKKTEKPPPKNNNDNNNKNKVLALSLWTQKNFKNTFLTWLLFQHIFWKIKYLRCLLSNYITKKVQSFEKRWW